jgi:hypothetical protein
MTGVGAKLSSPRQYWLNSLQSSYLLDRYRERSRTALHYCSAWTWSFDHHNLDAPFAAQHVYANVVLMAYEQQID